MLSVLTWFSLIWAQGNVLVVKRRSVSRMRTRNNTSPLCKSPQIVCGTPRCYMLQLCFRGGGRKKSWGYFPSATLRFFFLFSPLNLLPSPQEQWDWWAPTLGCGCIYLVQGREHLPVLRKVGRKSAVMDAAIPGRHNGWKDQSWEDGAGACLGTVILFQTDATFCRGDGVYLQKAKRRKPL